MYITNPPNLLRGLTPKFIPQQTIHPHLTPPLHIPRLPQRNVQHLTGLRNLIDNTIRKRRLSRPLVRLEQHLARDLRVELETREEADAGEVQA